MRPLGRRQGGQGGRVGPSGVVCLLQATVGSLGQHALSQALSPAVPAPQTTHCAALNEVIYSQPYQTHDDHSFVFLMQAGFCLACCFKLQTQQAAASSALQPPRL